MSDISFSNVVRGKKLLKTGNQSLKISFKYICRLREKILHCIGIKNVTVWDETGLRFLGGQNITLLQLNLMTSCQ